MATSPTNSSYVGDSNVRRVARTSLRLALALLLMLVLALPPQLSYAVEGTGNVTGPQPQQTEETNPSIDVVKQPTEEDVANSANENLTPKTAEDTLTTEANENVDAKGALTEEVATVQAEADTNGSIESIVANMTLDEKLSQMIIVAFRTWNKTNVTDLDAMPELAAALRKHQYGGVILYGSNIVSNEQAANLVQQLQANNKQITGTSRYIPYFVAADEEGGIVTRLTGGTRMTGNMAIGATGTNAESNARTTGYIIGSELKALGINVNFAPSIDVNNNPANPVIGTRSFSDDPDTVATLGNAWISGHAQTSTIATLKHFPGHGDTGEDTHIANVVAVNKTIEQLRACELVPFKAAIQQNADMIMTAHVTLPLYDDPVTFVDGQTQGYYPATMSHKVITDLLRGELGYDGVVVTDALEMDAIEKAGVVPGEPGSVESRANIAEKVINAGCDILLLPSDLTSNDAATFYDDYLEALATKVANGAISEARIDESVTRILKLKQKYGFLDEPTPTGDVSIVGSESHHAQEMHIAQEAITLVKNDAYTLPASARNKNVVLIGRTQSDNVALDYAVKALQNSGLVPEDAYVNNLAAGTTRGNADSSTKITIGYTYDTSTAAASYTDELKASVAEANVVVGIAKTYSLSALAKGAAQYEAIAQPMADAHAAGAKYVFISDNLPYDIARYQYADAILVAYMGSGTDVDPTSRADGSANVGAFNANLVAAVRAVFDDMPTVGTLPVEVPTIAEAQDGTLSYSSDVLYARGHGLKYDYLFVEGADSVHTKGSSDGLTFVNNARYDKLTSVAVDETTLETDEFMASAGSTNITLSGDYLNTLSTGDHTLKASYDYGFGPYTFDVQTKFSVNEQASKQTSAKTASTGSKESKTSTPNTADDTDVMAYAIPAIAALVLFGLALRMRRDA